MAKTRRDLRERWNRDMAKKRDNQERTDWSAVKVVARLPDVIHYERPARNRYGRHGGAVAELIPLARAAEQLEMSEAYLSALIVHGVIRSVMVGDSSPARWVPTDDMDDYLYPDSVEPKGAVG
jgi:hypothetical protein